MFQIIDKMELRKKARFRIAIKDLQEHNEKGKPKFKLISFYDDSKITFDEFLQLFVKKVGEIRGSKKQ
jgi:hypothetical protein